MSNGIMTLNDALALQALLSAVERKAVIARLDPTGAFVEIGEAQYIGRYDHQADDGRDVRDLFLFVKLHGDWRQSVTGTAWLIRTLIRQHRTGHCITDFDLAAFEAAGGQAAVPASLAEYRRVNAHKAQPAPGTVFDREDVPVTKGLLPAGFPVYGECRICGEPVRCYDITADWGHDSEFGEPYRFAHPVTPAERFLMRQARAWVADSFSPDDLGDQDVGDLEDREVYGGVAAHFDGGWAGFMRTEFVAPGKYPATAYVRDAGAKLIDVVVTVNADGWVALALNLPAGQEVWSG
jgi:hypothetical protein